jgi:UDP-glucuronate decarboxylase
LENKRILVTGGAGFVGSHLCKKLLNMGNEVICLDNFFSGKKENIIPFLNNKKFTLLNQDIIDPFAIYVDQIYNLACPASPIYYQKDPIYTVKTNVLGAVNVLNIAKRLNIPILQASTSEVYGDPIMHPQKETYWGNVNPIGPRSCYDEGKRCVETLFYNYRQQYNINTKIVRIFNTYGPNMRTDDGRVISNFIIQALKNKDITIYGDGKQTRSFCYIDDLINGLVKMMNIIPKITGPINLGNSSEFTILNLAKKIIHLTNSNSKLKFIDLPIDDPIRRKPAVDKAKKLLNWEASINLTIGLQNTIAYFTNYKGE